MVITSQVYGSAKMLQYARKNVPSATFILGDARTFKLSAEYDAVFSTFDSLNHVMTLTELEQVFENVYKCLNKDGIFIFDMNLQEHFETRMKEGTNSIREKPEYLYIFRNEYDEEKKLGKYTVTIFQSKDNLWKRSDIILYQTWYPTEDVKSALKKCGFTGIKTFAASPERGLHKPNRGSTRIFFFAQKP